jgi:hypothetical protein
MVTSKSTLSRSASVRTDRNGPTSRDDQDAGGGDRQCLSHHAEGNRRADALTSASPLISAAMPDQHHEGGHLDGHRPPRAAAPMNINASGISHVLRPCMAA